MRLTPASAAGQGTILTSENDAGVIVGEYIDSHNVSHGFVDTSGNFTTINAPGAGSGAGQGTTPSAISNSGSIDGTIINSSGVTRGWLLRDWQFTPLDDPHAGTGAGDGTFIKNISPNGDVVVGLYIESPTAYFHGFVVNIEG